MNVTFFTNSTSNQLIDAPILGLLEKIRTGQYQTKVDELAKITGYQERRDYKAWHVPCFTVSGTFANKEANSLQQHSGLIAIDFDHIDDLDEARALLYADPYTFSGFLSVSHTGLCIIVKIDGKKHREHFDALEAYYSKQYQLQIDRACKNVNRLRFFSSDPDLHLNADSTQFTQLPPKKPKEILYPKIYISSQDDFSYILQQIQDRRIDLTADYYTWIAIGQAIYSEYGTAGLSYFQAISANHPEYNPKQCEKKYNSFKGVKQKTISTFYYYAKQAGLQILTPETQSIKLVARNAKKQRSTPEDAIKTLQAIEGIEPERSKALVEQVFSTSDEDTTTDDGDLIQHIKNFIRLHYPMRYNEITLKYEFAKKNDAVTDRDMNSIYIECRQLFPKATKDLVFSTIKSNFITNYNPIKEFFKTHASNHTKTGYIKALADTIHTTTGTIDNYAYHFIRKWLVGAVAMWFKHHSPLVLVLAGTKQNTGKTFWLRHLIPQEIQLLFGESEFNGSNDDKLLMCSKAILLNDEMENMDKHDISLLKKLTSAQWFNLRKPYGTTNEDIRRIAAFCGTTNNLEIISDPTGNRRIIPIELLSYNHQMYNKIDKTALWCEAYHAYKAGESFHLSSDDIELLNRNTQYYYQASIEAELIQKYFSPATENTPNRLALSNTEIKVYIEQRTSQKLNSRKLGIELKHLGFEKKLVKSKQGTKRAYFLRENDDLSVTSVSDYDAPF